jgi:hypothetical protein
MDKTPIEIIQEIKDPHLSWEEVIQIEEIECLNETSGEEEIYDAETVRSEASAQGIESDLGHQPPRENQNRTPSIYINITIEEFYFTHANAISSFLWFHDRQELVELKSAEEVRKFLQDLKNGELRVVESFWGLEIAQATEKRKEIQEIVQKHLDEHENGKDVILILKEDKRNTE